MKTLPLALLLAATTCCASDLTDLLTNGDFAAWTDGAPDAWEISIGATEQDDAPFSSVSSAEMDGGRMLVLRGEPATGRWHVVTQSVAVTPGEFFRLSSRFRAVGVDRGEHRFTSCHVMATALGQGDKVLNRWFLGPLDGTTEWDVLSTHFQAPLNCERIRTGVFLSKNGELHCDGVALERLPLPTAAPDAPRAERWRADIAVLTELIPLLHPDPYTVIGEERWLARAQDLQARAAEMSDLELSLGLKAMTAQLGDAHTGVGFADRPQRLPVRFRFFGEDLRVLAVDKRAAELAGGRVLRLGGRPLADVLAEVRRLIAHETESWFRQSAPQFLELTQILEGLGLTEPGGALAVDVIAEDGTERSAAVTPAAEGVRPEFEGREPAEQPLHASRRGLYWYEHLEDERTLYLQSVRCHEDRRRPLQGFLADLTAYVEAHEFDRFVLDLRHNTGGSSGMMQDLYRTVAQRVRAGAIRQCYVITGRATFSAAALDALDFRRMTGARVVGEVMGNKPNRFGQVSSFSLPNSELLVRYSTKKFVKVPGDPPELTPDLPASPTWEGYMAGEDEAMAAVLGDALPEVSSERGGGER